MARREDDDTRSDSDDAGDAEVREFVGRVVVAGEQPDIEVPRPMEKKYNAII